MKNSLKLYFILIVGLLTSCSGYSATGGPGALVKPPISFEISDSFQPLRINSVGILPVEANSLVKSFDSETSSRLTDELMQAFSSNSSLDLQVLEPSKKKATLKERALRAGKAKKVQGVLVGLVSGGEPLSYESQEYKPVQFEIRLFDQKTGNVVWTALYASENKPLTDNLFDIRKRAKDKFRYKTRVGALREGFHAAALELEKLRTTSSKIN